MSHAGASHRFDTPASTTAMTNMQQICVLYCGQRREPTHGTSKAGNCACHEFSIFPSTPKPHKLRSFNQPNSNSKQKKRLKKPSSCTQLPHALGSFYKTNKRQLVAIINHKTVAATVAKKLSRLTRANNGQQRKTTKKNQHTHIHTVSLSKSQPRDTDSINQIAIVEAVDCSIKIGPAQDRSSWWPWSCASQTKKNHQSCQPKRRTRAQKEKEKTSSIPSLGSRVTRAQNCICAP